MKKFLFVAASVAAVAVATPAAAQPRVEIHGGWDHSSNGDVGEDGILYGVGVGYDVRVGRNAFVGVDLSADFSTADACENNVIVAGDRTCVDTGRDLAAGVRAGVNVSENTAIYALAGYTNARFRVAYTTPANVTTRVSENLDGFRIGAGVQQRLGGNLYAKAEYRYSNYEGGTDRHNVLLGVGITF
ncbi:MAG TPA: outer membrane beta-barrel protein [Allosphingosinicella sp.]|jgi:outer membrane immunogenic protein